MSDFMEDSSSNCEVKLANGSNSEGGTAGDETSSENFEINEEYFTAQVEEEELPNDKAVLKSAIERYIKLIRVDDAEEAMKGVLIRKLCDLRIRLNELTEEDDRKYIFGHELKLDNESEALCLLCSRKPLYLPLPPVLRNTLNETTLLCTHCGFRAHQGCLKERSVIRCPKDQFESGVGRKDSPLLILKICPEIGLSHQNFQCDDCGTNITFSTSLRCDYNGRYYCQSCHMSITAVIPARVVHNWDFEPRPVCNKSALILGYLRNKSILFDILNVNSMLYGLVEELSFIKRIRQDLCSMVKYIRLCKQPSKPKLVLSSHMFDESKMNCYTLQELCEVKELQKRLLDLHETLIVHITKECEGCKGKGFFCELCRDKSDLLFPFSLNIATCKVCSAVYHKNCYHRKKTCPRCQRLSNKEM